MEKVLWKGENVMKFWQSVIFLLHTSLFQASGLFRCQHLNNRKLDWRETAARNKALYIFCLIQLHPPGKLGVHSCVVNKIAKWQHDRMIETLIERLKRGAMWEEESKKRCKPHFFFFLLLKSSGAVNPFYVHKRLSSVVLAVRAQKRCSIQALPITTWIILPIKQSSALHSSELFLSVTKKKLSTQSSAANCE